MPTQNPRYCITVDDDLLRQIDDYRFENRYNSRSAATVELIRLGLESLKERDADEKEQAHWGLFLFQ